MRLLFAYALILMMGLTASAHAQRSDSIAAVVNDDVITFTDVYDRIDMIIKSSGMPNKKEFRQKLLPQVLTGLITESIQIQEAKRLGLQTSQEEIDTGFATIAQQNRPGADRRTVLIHGQYLRQDQVADLEALDIFPALYPMHTFYWGDWHRQSVAGPERAENISPTGWLLERDIKFSIHSDAPVTFPNSMRLLHSAVNRTTRSGYVIGPEHRLSPMEALKAMTIWPAYQHFEEDRKGTLEVGKLAVFVILDKNPLTVDRSEIKNIRVLETVKQGRTLYSVPGNADMQNK